MSTPAAIRTRLAPGLHGQGIKRSHGEEFFYQVFLGDRLHLCGGDGIDTLHVFVGQSPVQSDGFQLPDLHCLVKSRVQFVDGTGHHRGFNP